MGKTLALLFTKGGLQTQTISGKTVLEEFSFFENEETSENFISEKLDFVLTMDKFSEIKVISAINHFTMTPDSFSQHELGQQLISYNSNFKKEKEELMLSINRNFKIQFYYSFPLDFYEKIKCLNTPSYFNFSGEKFLNSLKINGKKQIHINLYHHQCEFFAFDKKKIILYNNLDINSEVDFLYFIMFTLSKIGFDFSETFFYVYGETTENETFISELRKFVPHIKINFDNIYKNNFILKI